MYDTEKSSYIIEPQRLWSGYQHEIYAWNLYRVTPGEPAQLDLIAHCAQPGIAEILRGALVDLSVLWAGDLPSDGRA